MKRILTGLVLGLSLTVCGGAVYAQNVQHDFNRGMEAAQRGDFESAINLWLPLAEQGFVIAQYNLGVVFGSGMGVEQDYAKALKWFRLAAAQGAKQAQTSIGRMYLRGVGVEQDDAEAEKWIRLAAKQGDSEAHSLLSFMYLYGWGVPQDKGFAYMWAILAAAGGNEDGIRLEEEISKTMSDEELMVAKALGRVCIERNFQGC